MAVQDAQAVALAVAVAPLLVLALLFKTNTNLSSKGNNMFLELGKRMMLMMNWAVFCCRNTAITMAVSYMPSKLQEAPLKIKEVFLWV